MIQLIIFFYYFTVDNKFTKVFKLFNDVVSCCFGKDLDPQFNSIIQSFVCEVKTVGIRFTPKLHILAIHVPEFCRETNQGLGFFSEQASEAVHHAFNEHCKDYNLNLNSKDYVSNLQRAVCVFNARRQ